MPSAIAIPPNEKYMSSQENHDNHLINILKEYKINVQYKKELFDYLSIPGRFFERLNVAELICLILRL